MSSSKPPCTGWRGWLIGNAAKENQRLKSLPVAKVQTGPDVLFAYKMRMGIGLLLMVGGAGVSLGTYLFPSGGGVYYVFWGVVVFGGILFFRGLDGWLDVRPRSHTTRNPLATKSRSQVYLNRDSSSILCTECHEVEPHHLDDCSHSQHMRDLWSQRHERKRGRKPSRS